MAESRIQIKFPPDFSSVKETLRILDYLERAHIQGDERVFALLLLELENLRLATRSRAKEERGGAKEKEYTAMKTIIFNSSGNALIRQCQDNGVDKALRSQNRSRLLTILRIYPQAAAYQFESLNEAEIKQNEVPSSIVWMRWLSTFMGLLTGELAGIFRVLKVVEGTWVLDLLRIASWFFYGCKAGASFFTTMWDLRIRAKSQAHAQRQPHEYFKTNVSSAIANLLVTVLNIATAVLLICSFASLCIVPAGWALSIGAVGTLVDWLGNHCIHAWRAWKESNEVIEYNKITPLAVNTEQVNKKALRSREANIDLICYLFMVAGMACMAAACFVVTPVFPLFATVLPMTDLTAVAIGCMIISAQKPICYIVRKFGDAAIFIAKKLCCCITFSEDSLPESKPTLSPTTTARLRGVSPPSSPASPALSPRTASPRSGNGGSLRSESKQSVAGRPQQGYSGSAAILMPRRPSGAGLGLSAVPIIDPAQPASRADVSPRIQTMN